MAQYGESNENRTSGYGRSGQTGSSGGTYQSGYRGDNRTQGGQFGQSGQYGSGSSYGAGGSYGSGYGQSGMGLQDYGSSADDYSGSYAGSGGTGGYGSSSGSGIAIEETHRLIGSDKVEGTAVYDRDGTRIGTIHNFMVDKRSGKAEYAVMSFGGFLGMGQTYYPLPWQMLDYDTDLGGFRVEMDEEDLDHAPSFRAGGEPEFDDQYGRQVHSYYGLGF